MKISYATLLFACFLTGCMSRGSRNQSGDTSRTASSVAGPSAFDGEEDLQPDPESETNLPVERSGRRLSFDWPVDEARLTRGFLPHKRGRPHLGIDLAASKGTPIFASHNGVVIYAGRDFRGYGKMVMIESSNGFATLYAHFSKIVVKQGTRVRIGDTIGLMGRTGRATGTHLHFEVRTDRGPVDPLQYLPNGSSVASYSK